MPNPRPPYPPEFRDEAVRLVRENPTRSIPKIAQELGISDQSLRNWCRQADVDAGRRAGLTSEERSELARLRRENEVLREEREILKKATAFFAADETR